MPSLEKRVRYEALDGWRGVCALLVAWYHVGAVGPISQTGIVSHAYLFVDFFFVLSGFVISASVSGRLDERAQRFDFIGRRFARLWPLHAATLAAFILLEFIRQTVFGDGFQQDRQISQIPLNLLLLHGLVPGQMTWNWPSWSISVEFFTYIAFAIFTLVPEKLRLLAAILLIAFSVSILGLFSEKHIAATTGLGLLRSVAGFFCGYIVYRLIGNIPVLRGTAWEIFAIILSGFGVWFFGESALNLLVLPIFGFAIYVFSSGVGAVSGLMTSRIGLLLGRCSYSIYLVHGLCVVVLRGGERVLLKGDGGGQFFPLYAGGNLTDLGAVLFLAVVVGISIFTYSLIEVPGKRLLTPRRRLRVTR